MKKVIKSMSVLLACGVLVFTACKKEKAAEPNAEQTIQTRDGGGEGDWQFILKNASFAAMFEANREANTESFIVNANEPIHLVTRDGIILDAPENSFVNGAGDIVDGEVQILFNGIMDRAQMLLQDRATSGLREDGSGVTALSSGGEFFIEFRQEGEEVTLNTPMNIMVPVDMPDPEMQMFGELEGTGDDLIWAILPELPVGISDVDPDGGTGGTFYNFELLPGLGTCNIDKFNIGCTGALSPVRVEVPLGFNPSNTEIYMIHCGATPPWRIANFDNWDAATNSFKEHGGMICEGECVHFVFVTNVGGTLRYAVHASVTIGPGSHVEVFTPPFTPTTPSAFQAIINALP